MKKLIAVLILWALTLLVASAICSQEVATKVLPDMPEPKIQAVVRQETPKEPVKVKVVDLDFKLEAGAMFAAWAADTITTHQVFEKYPLAYEVGLAGYGSRKTWDSAGPWLAVDAGMMLTSYEWKKHVTNKYLHPLWRLPMAWRTGFHANAAIHNAEFGPKLLDCREVHGSDGSLLYQCH